MVSIMQRFDPHKPVTSRSFALRTFNRYETEINEHFWSFKVISEYSRYIADQESKQNANTPTAEVFKATGPNARRIPPTVTEWLNAREELENWLRSSALVSAVAYHEAYLRQIVRSALMASPLCRLGLANMIDGTRLLKLGREIPYEQDIKEITKGDWSSRLASFGRYFGEVPALLQESVGSLEEIRKFRNNFAHGFGRDLKISAPSDWHFEPAQRLSFDRFMKHVGLLSKSAAAIDKCLLTTHVGCFEIIYFYHGWKLLNRKAEDAKYEEDRALQRCIARELGFTVSTEFCLDLIYYYNNA